jgi:DNA (cytosine-5)-methyltransferase 1
MKEDKLYAVDLFSGAGGLSLGFLQTKKIEIIAAVENNKYAQMTYKKNHPHVKLYDDIRDVDYDDILHRCRKLGKNNVDIVFGGPPCQGFSNANRQKTELISTNNRLVKEYTKAIEKLSPRAFVLENVKMLKSRKHKFFLSSNDAEVIELGLTISTERVSIGNKPLLSEELVEFLRQNNTPDLIQYIIKDKVLFSKLCHLVRKEKEFEKYLEKSRTVLCKAIDKWEDLHSEYWNDDYKKIWLMLRDEIQLYIDEDNYSPMSIVKLLKEIIEIQRILMRICEVSTNHINIHQIDCDSREMYIKVQTYGVLDYLITKLKKLNYVMNEDDMILNAADFGAPQIRERLFLLGIKKEVLLKPEVELPKPILKERYYTVRDAISDIEDIEPSKLISDVPINKHGNNSEDEPLRKYLNGGVQYLFNHIITDSTETALKRFSALKPGQNFHHLDESQKSTYSDPNRTQNTVYLRLDYDSPAGTVLNVRKSMWIHPKKNRAISIREAARLQTFPDSFIFMGTKDAQYQQIGNAVPPLLGRAVAEKVLEYLGVSVEEKLESALKADKRHVPYNL